MLIYPAFRFPRGPSAVVDPRTVVVHASSNKRAMMTTVFRNVWVVVNSGGLGDLYGFIRIIHGLWIYMDVSWFTSSLEFGRYKNIGQKVRQETDIVWAEEIPSTSWMAIDAGWQRPSPMLSKHAQRLSRSACQPPKSEYPGRSTQKPLTLQWWASEWPQILIHHTGNSWDKPINLTISPLWQGRQTLI